MDLGLEGKVVVVTGGSKGIGLACAQAFIAEHARVGISSVIGIGGKVASPIHVSGGAANAALMLATAGLASAYACHGVRVLAVNPGATNTERVAGGLEADAKASGISVDEAFKRSQAIMPLGRIAEPQEIANVVVFLASDKASYVTGANVSLDSALHPVVI